MLAIQTDNTPHMQAMRHAWCGALIFKRACGILRLAAALLSCLAFAGCYKRLLPEIRTLVRDSSVIYIAEVNNREYQVRQILKSDPSMADLYRVGQIVELYHSLGTQTQKSGETILVFSERLQTTEFNGGKERTQLRRTEIPVLPDGTLVGYRATVQEVISLVREVNPTSRYDQEKR